MTLRNITLERREKNRKVPDQFVFLQMEQDDGGTVLDLSEGGLRFEAFSPVPQHGPIQFWFSLNLRERIEAWGELAWTDADRKSGGLKFVSISEGGREQIREYLGHPAANRVVTKPAPVETDAVASFVSRARPRQSTLFPGKNATPITSTPFPATAAAAGGVLVPMQRHLAAMRRQLIIGLLIGACLAGIIAFAAIAVSSTLRKNRTQSKPAVENSAPTGSPESLPLPEAPASTATPKDVFAIENQKKGPASLRIPVAPPVDTATHTSRQKAPMKPDQLWAQVQAGNSSAAATLAELYIKGDGVPQSCAQARVLLLVASEKRNAAAIKRLADLDKAGCPAN
ncbi:MAG TPA: PilZ domain-containing protein [Candidatus Acidoferrum sp.]|nr:PilZ domain-containing protein [Candidatus Acidoferrum sp.]